MGTRAAAFSAKVRNLQDYHLRLIHQVQPLPSGSDIANTLKSLSATLLGVLKDVPGQPFVLLRRRENEQQRITCLPSLDYRGFHAALIQLLEVIPLITTGIQCFGQAVLQAVGALVPFLEQDLVDTLPYTVATCLAFFPTCLQPDIIQCLCCHLFPYTIGAGDYNDPANIQAAQSISAVLMMVLQFTTNNALHCQLLECLLQLRPDAVRHLLAVIAHAGESDTVGWKAAVCQNEGCPNRCDTEAVKLCEDHVMCLTLAPEKPPPIHLCEDCSDEIRRNGTGNVPMVDVLLPIQQVALTCENKNCRSNEKLALFTCFSPECALYNTNRPLRYCAQCHNIRHNDRRGADHVVHTVLPSVWEMDPETQSYIIESIVSLLREAQLHPSEKPKDSRSNIIIPPESERIDWLPLEERRLISRCGIWLLVSMVPPLPHAPQRALGRIIGMLLQWYHATAYLTDDQVGGMLEKLKSEILQNWMSNLLQAHQHLVISCLLPQAPDFARLGGSWDMLATKAVRVRDGIDRLFSLVPYEIINIEIWDNVMPEWISAIEGISGCPEVADIKNVLGKMFDPDMSPLGFESSQLYSFVTRKLINSTTREQEMGLRWLRVFSQLGISVPSSVLMQMFEKALSTIVFIEMSVDDSPCENEPKYDTIERPSSTTPSYSDDEISSIISSGEKLDPTASRLFCHVLMLDIILNQLELQEIPRHAGTSEQIAKDSLRVIRLMISESWLGRHECKNKQLDSEDSIDCPTCDLSRLWTRLAGKILEFFCPECRTPQISFGVEQGQWKAAPKQHAQEKKPTPEMGKTHPSKGEAHSLLDPKMLPGAVFINMSQVMTAKEETVGELEIAATIPSEKVVKAVAKAVPIADEELAVATAKVASLVNENDEAISVPSEEQGKFWQTSIGKFKFRIEDLPEELQLVYKVLKELPFATNVENKGNFLRLLTLLVLHEDALNRASKDHRGFFAWAQENLAIATLWPLLQESDSQSAQAAARLVLHCAALPLGSEILWNLIETDFKSPDWRIRFGAVEKVYILAQMGDLGTIRGSRNLQSLMANAFCFLIGCLDDAKLPIVRRAQAILECLHDDALRCLCWCLEQQFDCFVADRPQIIQCLQVLHNCLPKRRILSWNFFIERYDVIFVEVQIQLQKTGDIAYPRDLRNSDMGSDAFAKKLIRAQEALQRYSAQLDPSKASARDDDSSASHGVRPLSAKIPPMYKRTMSAPANVYCRTQTHEKENDKHYYNRQFSAPLLKNRPQRGYMDGAGKANSGMDDHHVAIVLQRILQQNDSDAESLHLLTYLLMQFMCRSDQTSDEKMAVKNQSLLLRHLALMLGYSNSDKTFCITSARLRSSPIFNAFISWLPKVMDCNIPLGNTLLQFALSTLIYCPAPQGGTKACNFSLWWLESHTRKSWLHTLLVILYKYRYSHSPVSTQIQLAVRIVLHTLHSHNHRCPPSYQTLAFLNKQYKHKDWSRNSMSSEVTLIDPESCRTPRLILATAALTAHSFDVARHGEANSTRRVSTGSDAELKRPISEALDELDVDLEAIPESPRSAELEVAVTAQVGVEKLLPTPAFAKQEEIPVVAQVQQAITVQRQTQPKTEPIRATSAQTANVQIGYAETAKAEERPRGNIGKVMTCLPVEVQCAKVGMSSVVTIQEQDTTVGRALKGHHAKRHAKPSANLTPTQEMPRLSIKGPLVGTALVAAHTAAVASATSTSVKVGEAVEVKKDEAVIASIPKTQRLSNVSQQGKGRQRRQGVVDNPPRVQRDMKQALQLVENVPIPSFKQSNIRVGEDCVGEKCPSCGNPVEEFSDEDLSLCVVVICTFVHREPTLAAPLLPEMLRTCASLSATNTYSWQSEQNLHIPGNSGSAARQFVRCVLHQLSPIGIFPLLFQTNIPTKLRSQFFSTMAFILADFNELSPFAPLQMLLEQLNTQKRLAIDRLRVILPNIACYLECLPLDVSSSILAGHWSTVLAPMETFFYKVASDMTNFNEKDAVYLFRVINAVLKCQATSVNKEILEPIMKITSYMVQHWNFPLKCLTETLRNSSRTYSRDRERLSISRNLVSDMISALRFKAAYSDSSLLYLTGAAVHDHGGLFSVDTCYEVKEALADTEPASLGVAECLRPYMTEVLDFIGDVHSLAKIKSSWKLNSVLFDEALGGSVKAGLSHWICMESVRAASGPRAEPRMLGRLLPWLQAPPAPFQQGAREYLECLSHIRLISWLLNGALRHLATMPPSKDTLNASWAPVQLDSSCQLAEHVQAIMAGFAEQSKASVLHMSSLFHAFLLCQLWTVYLEQLARSGTSDNHLMCQTVILDFWIKVTPSVLHLIAHSKVLSEMVSLHFLTMIESLRECQSSLVPLLLPVWSPVLHANANQLPSHLEVRYQVCLNAPPQVTVEDTGDSKDKVNQVLIKWLQKCSLKMAQIELQSSAAAQFYTV